MSKKKRKEKRMKKAGAWKGFFFLPAKFMWLNSFLSATLS